MDSPVALLYRLQDLVSELAKTRHSRETMPPDVAELAKEFETRTARVGELAGKVGKAKTERAELERQITEANDRLIKFQTQLMSVRTNKEYSAALNEIDSGRKEVKSLNERLQAIEQGATGEAEELAALEAELPAEREAFEAKIASFREHQKSCDAAIARLTAEIDEVGAKVPRRLRSQFDQLVKRRDGVAVVRVVDAFCSACNVRLRPALFQQLKKDSQHEIMTCDSCQRILHYVEE